MWEQCAALSASLVPLSSLPQRQGLALFLFPCLRPLSRCHSQHPLDSAVYVFQSVARRSLPSPHTLLKMWTQSRCPPHLSKLLTCATVFQAFHLTLALQLLPSLSLGVGFAPSYLTWLPVCIFVFVALNGQILLFFLFFFNLSLFAVCRLCFLIDCDFSMLILLHPSVPPRFLAHPQCLHAFTCCVGAVSADYDLGQLCTERE